MDVDEPRVLLVSPIPVHVLLSSSDASNREEIISEAIRRCKELMRCKCHGVGVPTLSWH